ncbi:XkdX family protein [Robertmurraya siralis]|uniref:XkdX family protein n=1 Tax=Robertmurraya siralis TaxID=77777 RepID=UPI0010F56400|nr:XkdX family protein [Robertmurraya siralis]
MVNTLLTKQYAVCVYVYGTRNFETVVSDYHEPVKEYAAKTYTLEQIDNALVKGYITEQEYQDTMKYTIDEEVEAPVE